VRSNLTCARSVTCTLPTVTGIKWVHDVRRRVDAFPVAVAGDEGLTCCIIRASGPTHLSRDLIFHVALKTSSWATLQLHPREVEFVGAASRRSPVGGTKGKGISQPHSRMVQADLCPGLRD